MYILGTVLLALAAFIVYYRIVVDIDPPTEFDPRLMGYELSVSDSGLRSCGESWSRINHNGLGELYVQGGPLELGIMHGILLEDYIQLQEEAFVKQIRLMIPSESYLKFLRYFLAWFNKDLDTYIDRQYLLEIYGVSAFASNDFGFIGARYDRILNYHAAHDIGHALQNMNLVECTAFGLWDEKSSDSSLLIGRNFDFYVGDAFAENKIIAFVNPDKGYKYASVTWAGMIGVVSGMNEKGLTVSLNSAKSEIPFGARTPVSIIAREILQYASNIEEAVAIASKRSSFVSESFLIGSATDGKAVVIEKSTEKTLVYDPDTNFIILTNHFQSDEFLEDPLNIENMENETSTYRNERVQELLNEKAFFDYQDAARILRDQKGLGGKDIGMANEKAINQLIAHHSVIFEPEKKRFWISTAPWQLGPYLCYELDEIFDKLGSRADTIAIYSKELLVEADTFLMTNDYRSFLKYRELAAVFQEAAKEGEKIGDEESRITEFIASNPEFFHMYFLIGDYYMETGQKAKAIMYLEQALTKEIASVKEKEKIENAIQACKE